jgi:transposase-like protein
VGYSPERKAAVLKRMLPPNNMAIRQLSQEEGISEATLHKWRTEARGKGQLLPDAGAGPEGWSSRDKFSAVLETAALNEVDLAEYCRTRQHRRLCPRLVDRGAGGLDRGCRHGGSAHPRRRGGSAWVPAASLTAVPVASADVRTAARRRTGEGSTAETISRGTAVPRTPRSAISQATDRAWPR